MTIRIAKFIADTGAASRRGAEELINAGRVSVNGRVVDTPVFFISDGDRVEIDGHQIHTRVTTELFAFHKPVRTMTTAHDPAGRRTIYDVLPPEYRHLKYVGRLDYNTSGLLLLTNDGELARRLTLPACGVRREYIATVARVDMKKLAPATRGITVDGIKYRPMGVEKIDDHNLRVTVCEGKKNEVRIVLASCGHPVRALHRISFGNIELGDLASGKIKQINQKTIDALSKSLLVS